MNHTVYQITRIRMTKSDTEVGIQFDIPMNVPLMFIRTKNSRLGVKRLYKRHRRTIIERNPEQVALL